MLFLSDSPYLKLLLYIVSTIIKEFIIHADKTNNCTVAQNFHAAAHNVLH
jgi:hypothetical protein